MPVFRLVLLSAAILIILLPLSDSLAQEPPATLAGMPDAEIATAPVRFDERTLFSVRGTTSFPAPERAAGIAARIRDLASDSSVEPESMIVVPSDLGLDIRAGKQRLMTVVTADAILESVSLETLAAAHRQKIAEAITEHRAEREPGKLLRGLGFALLATAVYYALLLVLRRVFGQLQEALERRVQAHVAALPGKTFQLVQGRQIWEAVRATVRGLHWILLILLFYFWLDVVLAQFPWTRPLGDQLTGLLTDPLVSIGTGLIDFVPNLLFLIVLTVVIRYGLRLIKVYFNALERGTASLAGFEPEWSMPAYKIVRALTIGLALVMAYPYLPGAGSDALQGVSVFAGLLLSLGAAGTVSNLIAGYFNTFGRVFRVGDFIKVGEVMGEVTQVRLLTTRVRTIKNEEVTIPNGTIINTHLVNYTVLAKTQGLILHTEVGIGYEVPWRQVHAMLEEAARRTPGLLPEPPAFILQRQLADFAVVYQLNVYAGSPKGMADTYSKLHQNILDVFNEYGVQIMTPAYEGDTPEPKLVPRDQWYAAPATPPGPPAGR
ncbi:MAG: mechanosensitive ion channel family protein [Gammaproteobacteria bacterium]|nr:mechanosensitive ion channel family protein [Gammaproteobacteria bacterium]